MVTVIIGTNRKDNLAQYFAAQYLKELESHQQEARLLDLSTISYDWVHQDMFSKGGVSESLMKIQDEYILSADKFVIVSPEYNGGNPGILKLFIDACSARSYSDNFKGKKVLLAGVASGRAGNLRGMDHLTGVLNYLGAVIYPEKNPYSQINELMDATNKITDPLTLERIRDHVKAFVGF